MNYVPSMIPGQSLILTCQKSYNLHQQPLHQFPCRHGCTCLYSVPHVVSESPTPQFKSHSWWFYTPVHLVESVENCGMCMRWYLACSSYANVMHWELAITRALCYDASARDQIMRNRSLPSLPLSCTGFNFYWLDEVNRSISHKAVWKVRYQ